MDRTKIPTKYDLAENDFCLDTLSMLKEFIGKTYDEAYALCRDSSVAEDFSYMKVVGLKFYLQVAFDYLKSDEVIDEDWGFPSGLLWSLPSCDNGTLLGTLSGPASVFFVIGRILAILS